MCCEGKGDGTKEGAEAERERGEEAEEEGRAVGLSSVITGQAEKEAQGPARPTTRIRCTDVSEADPLPLQQIAKFGMNRRLQVHTIEDGENESFEAVMDLFRQSADAPFILRPKRGKNLMKLFVSRPSAGRSNI